MTRFFGTVVGMRPIYWLGSDRKPVKLSLFKAALTDKRLQVRFSAAVVLVHIDDSATEAIPVLIEALHRMEDRELALEDVPAALAHLGPRAKAAIPSLIALVTKGCDNADVVMSLVQIDHEGKECLPALISALKTKATL